MCRQIVSSLKRVVALTVRLWLVRAWPTISDPVPKKGQVCEASFCRTDLQILCEGARNSCFPQASSSFLPSEGQYWPPREFHLGLGSRPNLIFFASHVNPWLAPLALQAVYVIGFWLVRGWPMRSKAKFARHRFVGQICTFYLRTLESGVSCKLPVPAFQVRATIGRNLEALNSLSWIPSRFGEQA